MINLGVECVRSLLCLQRRQWRAIAAIMVLAMSAMIGVAQSTTSSVYGTITDSAGAVVVGGEHHGDQHRDRSCLSLDIG